MKVSTNYLVKGFFIASLVVIVSFFLRGGLSLEVYAEAEGTVTSNRAVSLTLSVEPKRIPIPLRFSSEQIGINFSLAVNNGTDKPMNFSWYGSVISPKIINGFGESIRADSGTDATSLPTSRHILTIPAGEIDNLDVKGILGWQGYQLKLIVTVDDTSFTFSEIERGDYQLCFEYENMNESLTTYDPQENQINDIWTGYLSTQEITIKVH